MQLFETTASDLPPPGAAVVVMPIAVDLGRLARGPVERAAARDGWSDTTRMVMRAATRVHRTFHDKKAAEVKKVTRS
ncbi:hypothetical protein EUA93_16085 [Nocardioides oleivorans]|uniref:Uncharacterized protein n=1 Tax=Nocardioides oleivorans TaxID=273676 RepID=A0A4Q2RSW6_9ACTN|nr:hypothetical protein [Nocardioides oleivorans]RYB91676.1 hypothetical protein EUA93_16085 [Nocardioides oleivorans]